MKQYLDGVKYVLENGKFRPDRTGTGTYSVFGYQTRYKVDLKAFPMITTKEVNFDSIVKELLWFLSGDTNSKTLEDQGCNIWKEWGLEEDHYDNIYTEKQLQEMELMDLNSSATCCPGFPHEEHIEILKEPDYHKRKALYAKKGFKSTPYQNTPTHAKGELGPVYGKMWRQWPTAGYYDASIGEVVHGNPIDQIKVLMENLKKHPYSRRHIVSGWNPELVPDESKSHKENILSGKQVLCPCHVLFQFYVSELTLSERLDVYFQNHTLIALGGMVFDVSLKHKVLSTFAHVLTYVLNEFEIPTQELSLQLYQRSQDVGLGECYNITSYSLLLAMVAHCLNMSTGDFVHSTGDKHIYSDHVDGLRLQLTRTPKKLPTLLINPNKRDIFSFELEDFKLIGYEHDPIIKLKVAV